MKAHRVRCQACAGGVVVVIATRRMQDTFREAPRVGVYPGTLLESDAITAMVEEMVIEEVAVDGSEPVTAEDIRRTWNFDVRTKAIRIP